jgi:NitT/TauT family transport system substrate-binding protein
MKRARLLTVLGAATLAPGAAGAQTPPTVRIGMSLGDAVDQAYYADKGGFFTKAGLNAQIVRLGGGNQIVSGILSGDIETGTVNISAVAAAHSRGLPIYVIAPGSVMSTGRTPVTVLAVLADAPYRSGADLAGKTVALQAVKDLEQAALMNWIDKTGGDSKSVNYIEVPHAAQPAALQGKRVDAAVLTEPWITDTPGLRIIGNPYGSLGRVVCTFAWVVSQSYYAQNAATVAKLRSALLASAHWINTNPAATAPMLADLTQIPVATILKMTRAQFGESLDPAAIQPVIDASARYGFLNQTFPASQLLPPA